MQRESDLRVQKQHEAASRLQEVHSTLSAGAGGGGATRQWWSRAG